MSETRSAADVAVRNAGTFGNMTSVTKINANGLIEVDEYSYLQRDAYSHRKSAVGSATLQFSSFIHLSHDRLRDPRRGRVPEPARV